MKHFIKKMLQQMLGLNLYLRLFCRFKVLTLRWDKKERDFFRFLEVLPDDAVILDIGANIGIMTLTAVKEKPKVSVHAFEPLQVNYRVLLGATGSSPRVKTYFMALSDKEEMLTMEMPVHENVRMQGLSRVVKQNDTAAGDVFEVMAHRLDGIKTIQELPRIDGIKIDVEEHEAEVLRGSLETLRKFKPVLYIELWDSPNRTACLQILKDTGYEGFVFKNGERFPLSLAEPADQNFLFIHPSKK